MTKARFLRRREVLASGLCLASLAAARPALAALVATPRQSTGPFYPARLPLDRDNDLIHVDGRAKPAAGIPTEIVGRIIAEDGRPVGGVTVEIWQCDAFGRYHHPLDRRGPADPDFQGYGRIRIGADGAYRFRTIRPVPYPGRAPHIHFALSGPGVERFTTQMYVAGEPLNDVDFLLNRVADPKARASLIVALEPAPEGAAGTLSGRFDVVLGRSLIRS